MNAVKVRDIEKTNQTYLHVVTVVIGGYTQIAEAVPLLGRRVRNVGNPTTLDRCAEQIDIRVLRLRTICYETRKEESQENLRTGIRQC